MGSLNGKPRLTPTVYNSIKNHMIQSQQQYLELINKVNQLRNEVHLFSEENISDEALDNLKMQITNWEHEHPDQIDPNSPNYTIAGGVAEGFSKVEHLKRMLSLNDIFDNVELLEWQQRWQDYATKNEIEFEPVQKYIAEPKIDGLAVSLIYQNGELLRAVTRGDGFVGEDVTNNVLQIKSIPKKIPDLRNLEVRGEIFMTKSDFEDLNSRIIEGKSVGKMSKTGPEYTFANPRNVASGTIRQLDSSVVADRNLSFIAYYLDINPELVD
jgi:DNA ligase (NAD+)